MNKIIPPAPRASPVWMACTVLGGDVTDDVDFIHGDLPVCFLLTEAQSSALLPVTGVTVHTQEHGALQTQHTLLPSSHL